MFSWFKTKKNKSEDESNMIEYSFLWYKKMVTGNKTFYTQPFRTKVKAKNYEDAKEKVTNFALRKMELIVIGEDSFDKTDLAQFEKTFDSFNKTMDNFFGKIKNKK